MSILLKRLSSFLAILLAAAAVRAADTSPHVWYLSTRTAAHCCQLDDPAKAVRYWRLKGDCDWSAAEAKDFHPGHETAKPTVVFIHGNQTDADEAVEKGWYAREAIRSEAKAKPFRYVIWSWPADRVCRRNRPDVQLKAEYSNAESYYLAAWLRGVQRGGKVSLVGHSFGPRIITGALHLLAGGELAGRTLPPETVAATKPPKPMQIRAVLLADASDADSLAPCGRNGMALSMLDKGLITCNGCDRVLKWYPRMYGRGGPEAIGFVGACGIDDPQKIALLDVSAAVGRTHDYRCYCSALNSCGYWPHYTFLDDK
jgi:pimeloyl-ACP methyl ester carboxylesterase